MKKFLFLISLCPFAHGGAIGFLTVDTEKVQATFAAFMEPEGENYLFYICLTPNTEFADHCRKSGVLSTMLKTVYAKKLTAYFENRDPTFFIESTSCQREKEIQWIRSVFKQKYELGNLESETKDAGDGLLLGLVDQLECSVLQEKREKNAELRAKIDRLLASKNKDLQDILVSNLEPELYRAAIYPWAYEGKK